MTVGGSPECVILDLARALGLSIHGWLVGWLACLSCDGQNWSLDLHPLVRYWTPKVLRTSEYSRTVVSVVVSAPVLSSVALAFPEVVWK
jgi:hypothetical protein